MNKYESNQPYTGNITELAAKVRKELNIEQGVSVKEAFEKSSLLYKWRERKHIPPEWRVIFRLLEDTKGESLEFGDDIIREN